MTAIEKITKTLKHPLLEVTTSIAVFVALVWYGFGLLGDGAAYQGTATLLVALLVAMQHIEILKLREKLDK